MPEKRNKKKRRSVFACGGSFDGWLLENNFTAVIARSPVAIGTTKHASI